MPNSSIQIPAYRGKVTSVVNPPMMTARTSRNLVLNRILGALMLKPGLLPKFDDVGGINLPNFHPSAPNYLPAAIHKMQTLVWKDGRNFWCPDHGGQNVTVVVGTYRKTGWTTVTQHVDRMGVWARPYWDGSAWVDSWIELTEQFVFEITSLGSASASGIALQPGPRYLTNVIAGSGATWGADGSPAADPGAFTAFEDGINAVVTLTAAGGATPNSYYLKLTPNVLLSDIVPAGSTIVGISAHLRGKAGTAGAEIHIEEIKLVKNDSLVGVAKTDSTVWGTVNESRDFGGVADLWSTSYVLSDTISVAIYVKNYDAAARTFYLDLVELTIYVTPGGPDQINISEGAAPFGFLAADPGGDVFNDEYFKGWTIVYEAYTDAENYDLVTDCGYDGAKYFLKVPHNMAEYPTRGVGDILFLQRSFIPRDLPYDIVSWMTNLLSEIRFTSGNDSLAVSLMVKNRDFTQVVREMEGLILDTAALEVWKYGAFVAVDTFEFLDTTNGLVAGPYYMKYALRMDDGSTTILYDAFRVTGGSTITANNNLTLTIQSQIRFTVYRSLGGLSRRCDRVSIYLSNDNVRFYKVKDIDLADVLGISDTRTFPFGVHKTAENPSFTITVSEWDNSVLVTEDIGRDADDDGIIRASTLTVIDGRMYAAGVRDASNDTLYVNKLFAAAIHGDGLFQNDVFPNNALHAINLEYDDGDELVVAAPLSRHICALKRRSIIVLRKDSQLGFVPISVTKGYGIASALSLAAYDDALYFLDYNAVIRFTLGNITVINPTWREDLHDTPTATLEAAIGILDRKERQYRLQIGDIMYVLDLDTGEWTEHDYDYTPLRFFPNDRTSLPESISGESIFVLGSVALHNGNPVAFQWRTNEYEHTSPSTPGTLFDMLLRRFTIRYDSDVDITLKIYRNRSDEVMLTKTLRKEWKRKTFKLDGRCSSFSVEFSGSVSDEDLAGVKIEPFIMLYDSVEVMGDQLEETT